MKISLLIFLLLFFTDLEISLASTWHTAPENWKEPRIYHTPFQKEYESRIVLAKIDKKTEKISEDNKKYSLNRSYWFYMKEFKSNSTDIFIFNERNYLLKISLLNHSGQYEKTVYWINEKLIYIQFWWGRILGSYLIFDVEKEKFIYKEMINDGQIPFFQWQERQRQ